MVAPIMAVRNNNAETSKGSMYLSYSTTPRFFTMPADPGGQVMVFFIMAVAAAEVAVGLAILVMIFRNVGGVDINLLNKLKW